MCGIFGFMSSNPAPIGYDRFIRDAFITGSVRGDHGAGMLTVNPKGDVEHLAAAVSGYDFVSLKAYDGICRTVDKSVAVVGHNRYATTGSHIDEHCHPFSFGDIVGVHNGSVQPHVMNRITEFQHPVDSARLYHAISAAADPLDVLKQIYTGAYALVWYNKVEKAIYMARNSDRPLHVVAGDTGVSFASEAGMLSWLGGRHRLYDKRHRMSALNTHTLYRFPLDNLAEVGATTYKPEFPVWGWQAPQQQRFGGHRWDADEDVGGEWWMYEGVNPAALSRARPIAKPSGEPYRVHLTLTHLETQHPQLWREIPHLKEGLIENKESFYPEIEVALFGETQSTNGIDGFYGVLMSPGTNRPISDIPVLIEAPTAQSKQHYRDMLTAAAAMEPINSTRPVVRCHADRFVATVDGWMFVWGKTPELNDPTDHIHSFAPHTVKFCHNIVEGKDFDQMSPHQIQALWENTLYGTQEKAL